MEKDKRLMEEASGWERLTEGETVLMGRAMLSKIFNSIFCYIV